MQRKRGTRRPRRQHKHDRPSTYIQTITTIRPGTKVVLWCRVSSGHQNATGNNADQEADLRAVVEARGGTVMGTVAHEGRIADADAALFKAANLAVQTGAVLVAESVSRFVRHHRYHPKLRPHLTPTTNDLRDLRWLCGGVTLVTLLDPDAMWQDERGYQSKRGQRRKGKPGGRPTRPGYKKRRRERLLPEVRRLHGKGMSYRGIARAVGTNERNVRRWVRRFL